MDRKAIKTFKVATLLGIITLFLATSPRLISSQITDSLKSKEKTIADISNGLNEKYLRMFNFTTATLIQNDLKSSGNMATSKSNYVLVSDGRQVEIVSTINIRTDVMTGYEYRCQFSSGDLLNCFVYESLSKVTNGNRVTTNMKQAINGTYNYELLATEEKVLGDPLTKYVDMHLILSNSSGNYFLNVKGDLELTADESSILSGNIALDQNFFTPFGQYLVKLEQAPNLNKIENQLNVFTACKATVTMPDGQLIDPLTFSWLDLNAWGAMLTGFAIAWAPFETVTIGLILSIAGSMIGPLSLVGITVLTVGLIFDAAGFYQSSMEYTIMYFETIEILWLGSIPVYGEVGYYTDQILTPGGYQYIGWTFLPLSPYNFGPHANIWPNGFG